MRKFSTLKRGPTGHARMATALAAVGALVISGGLVMLGASTATADPAPQVVVCKYVSTPPGALHHVVIVSENTLNNTPYQAPPGDGIGDSWTDAQGQEGGSVVIRYAKEGENANDVSLKECPGYVEEIPVPPMPRTSDPCNPPGVAANIAFVVPPDTEQVDWTLLANGDVKVEPKAGFKFVGESQSVTFNLPADSGVLCDSTVTIAPPGAPSTTDPCDPGNIYFNVPADTTQLDYTLLGNGNVTVAPKPGYVFSGTSQFITFTLPADSNVPCSTTVGIDPPGAPSTADPCDPGNIYFNVPTDTSQLDYTLLANGNVTVAPQPGYVFSGTSQLITFTLPADSGVPCPLGVEEIAPEVTFANPDCEHLEGADWSGTLTEIVKYKVTGTPDLGETVTVTATIKPSMADQYAFPDGFDNTFDHTYPTLVELDCVLGEETVAPSPKPEKNPPVVLGTEAAVPTQVHAGMATLPTTGSPTNVLLAQLMVAGGLLLLVAGGWVGLGSRSYGKHHI